jgi:hypothetical protein
MELFLPCGSRLEGKSHLFQFGLGLRHLGCGVLGLGGRAVREAGGCWRGLDDTIRLMVPNGKRVFLCARVKLELGLGLKPRVCQGIESVPATSIPILSLMQRRLIQIPYYFPGCVF